MPIPDWRSCFWHAGLRLFLVVYVDDFKMSGPQDHMAKGWALIRKHIRTDPPQAVGKYLGCEHIVTATTLLPGHSGSEGARGLLKKRGLWWMILGGC